MMFWCQGAGLDFPYALKLVPWYERTRGGQSMLMVDSGVRSEAPDVHELAAHQLDYADVAVCPDILGDAALTVARTEEWLPLMDARPQVIRVLCTQGTIDERIAMIDRFASCVQWSGAGLAQKSPGVPFDDDERDEILEAVVPVAHEHGLKFHAFGIGATLRQLRTLHRLGVDSFDSSTPVLLAGFGKVLDEDLNQVRIGGVLDAAHKRNLVALFLRSISNAIEALGARGASAGDAGQGRRRASARGLAQIQTLPGC